MKKTHGMVGTREYQTWLSMKRRCYDKKSTNYKRYGGRGILVCQRWLDSFEAFYEDMGPRPEGKFSIDRIDGARGYEPSNCRWATPEEQNRNRINNVNISIGGKTMTAAEWGRELGSSGSCVVSRLKRGWTPEEAASRKPWAPPGARRGPMPRRQAR